MCSRGCVCAYMHVNSSVEKKVFWRQKVKNGFLHVVENSQPYMLLCSAYVQRLSAFVQVLHRKWPVR